eukprot:TRINITY_DN15246_c0_g1_i1.p1 TRINITY_DN15246_c0_g1~~TRINITY_DN15246_c0_g1_i1.p1  ORF type:complete len:346 (-),score=80.79 TRINITY_DN15246_c0_g1_i1:80-1057(-)
MAVPVTEAVDSTAPGTSQSTTEAVSPVKAKGVEVDGSKDEVDLANKGDTGGDANLKEVTTPEDSKTRVPRPYLEIETGDEDDTTSPDYYERKISLDLTPLSCKSTDSAAEYHQPNQTIIIFDWDDTLCPSTTCMRQYGLSVLGALPEGELAAALEDLAVEGKLLIEAAAELAEKVVVVTNAEEGWVDLSCKAWLPGLQDTIAKCEVASARSTWEPRGVTSPAGWKARTFEDVIEKFYARYPNQSWKNIISVGDAPHEREALARVVRWAPGGHGKRCRSKSVKFVLRPSIEQLTRELQMLRDSIKEIVWHDDDLDLHFSAESLADP